MDLDFSGSIFHCVTDWLRFVTVGKKWAKWGSTEGHWQHGEENQGPQETGIQSTLAIALTYI